MKKTQSAAYKQNKKRGVYHGGTGDGTDTVTVKDGAVGNGAGMTGKAGKRAESGTSGTRAESGAGGKRAESGATRKRAKSPAGERELSLDILLKVSEGAFLNRAMAECFDEHRDMSPASRSFITMLCEGVTERRLTLDFYISSFSNVKLQKMKPVIKEILRMGIYQITYMDRVPDFAVVNESVALAGKRGYASLRGFVNGVLRNYIRQGPVQIKDECIRYSVPEWIAELFEKEYGAENSIKMMEAGIRKPPLVCRIFPGPDGAGTVERVAELLERDGVDFEVPDFPVGAVTLKAPGSVRELEAFKRGYLYVQDYGSQIFTNLGASCLSGMKNRDLRVLDLCSAPGGKALGIAAAIRGRGQVLAGDVSPAKIKLIEENRERLGTGNLSTRVFDATIFDPDSEGRYDLVIADVPCSGLGVLSRKADLKYRLQRGDIKELAALGRRILDNAVRYVKKGGYLLYGTCTVTADENRDQMQYVLDNYDFEPSGFEDEISPHFAGRGADGGCLQLLQGVDESDGFFICRMKKK